jgi:hypothetical protein
MDATRAYPPTAREFTVVPALAGVGVAAGIAAKAADESGVAWAAALGSFPAVWVLAVALLGRCAPTWVTAAVRSSAFFAAMSVAYYTWAAEVLDFDGNVRLLVGWFVLALTVVPATAVAVWWATRREGVVPGALLGGVTAIVLAGGAAWWQIEIWTGMQPFLVDRTVQAVVDVVVALVLVVGLPRHVRTRIWASVLTIPLAWVLWLSHLLQQTP